MCPNANIECQKAIAISNFILHLINIGMHIYYYCLATERGIILCIIGILLLVLSLYNYLLLCGFKQEVNKVRIYIWKICCMVELLFLVGTGFAEIILIVLYKKYLYIDISNWYLFPLCVCATLDVLGHILFLVLMCCCTQNLQTGNRNIFESPENQISTNKSPPAVKKVTWEDARETSPKNNRKRGKIPQSNKFMNKRFRYDIQNNLFIYKK